MKEFTLASIATATGPTDATALRRSDSLPLAIFTTPVAVAPEFLLEY